MKKQLWIALASTLVVANCNYAKTVTTHQDEPVIQANIVAPMEAPFRKSSFYLGAGVGSSVLDYHTQIHEPNPTINSKTYGNGTLANFQGGYQYSHDKYSLAIDGFANVTTQRTNNYTVYGPNGDSRNMRYANDWNAGVSLLPGYLFNEFLIAYLRVGYVNSHYQVNTQGSTSSHISKNMPGGQIGLGGEVWFPMLKNFSVRGEFDAILAPTWNNVGPFTTARGNSDTARLAIANSLFQINFIYHFPEAAAKLERFFVRNQTTSKASV